jgi:adenylate kinase
VTSATATRYIVLLGGPGAGKGTQAAALTKSLGLPHPASGDIFRSVRQEDSELGAMVRSYYDKGLLVPDEATIAIILAVLSRADYASGAMLDGFPRTLEQAKTLDRQLEASGKAIARVLYLHVPPEELIRRISGRLLCRNCDAVYHERNSPPRRPGVCDRCGGELYQRVDDTLETARTRLERYFHDTEPLVSYYRLQGNLCEVDGTQSVEAVERELQHCVIEKGL